MQPTRNEGRVIPLLLDFAPDEVYRAGLVAPPAVGSCPTFSPLPWALTFGQAPEFAFGKRPGHFFKSMVLGGLFSVALSVASRRPGVTRRHALRSPDFPPSETDGDGPACLPYSFILRRLRLLLPRRPIPPTTQLRSDPASPDPFHSENKGYGCNRDKI